MVLKNGRLKTCFIAVCSYCPLMIILLLLCPVTEDYSVRVKPGDFANLEKVWTCSALPAIQYVLYIYQHASYASFALRR